MFNKIIGTKDNPGKVSNLTINNPSISTGGFGSALAFCPDGSVTLENVHINGGSVTTTSGAGSFFGFIQASDHRDWEGANEINFVNCSSSRSITGSLNSIAGFVGPVRFSNGSIKSGFKINIHVDEKSKYTGNLIFVNPDSSKVLSDESDYVIADDWYGMVHNNCTVTVDGADQLADVTSKKATDNNSYTIYNYKKNKTRAKNTVYNTTDGNENSAYKTDISTFKVAKVSTAVKAVSSIVVGVTEANYVANRTMDDSLTSTTEDGKEYFVTSKAKSYKIGINGHFYDQNGNKITSGTPNWTLTASNANSFTINGDYLMLQGASATEESWKKAFGLYGAKAVVTQYDKDGNVVGLTTIAFAKKSAFEDLQ